jgi:hypothetical protein
MVNSQFPTPNLQTTRFCCGLGIGRWELISSFFISLLKPVGYVDRGS